MSKSILAVLLGLILIASTGQAIAPVSLRMRGLSPALVGIVDDEYSDIFYNPAFINKVDGNRLYTNLSNLQGSGEDLIFDKAYYPYFGSYNLYGGITEMNSMKLGALLEVGGYDFSMSGGEYSTEIENGTTYIDSVFGSWSSKYSSTAFNLLWGKKMSNFDIGVLLGPKGYTYEDKSIYTEISYTINPSMTSYDYAHEEMVSREKSFAVPVVVGMIMGEPQNEMAFSLGYGYERESGIVPVDYLNSQLTNDINSYLETRIEDYWKNEYAQKNEGFYLALNGRNKKRFEDYSLSYLGEITYAHQPMTMNYIDTTYQITIYDTTTGAKRIESSLTTQKGKGTLNQVGIGLGIGTEKYFDIMNTNTMFAVGLLPAFFTGTYKMTVSPEKYYEYYYRNYPDTLEYTISATDNETWEIQNTFGGLTLTVPVGLETHLTDRLSLRLGATQRMILKFNDKYEETLIDSGEVSTYHQTKPIVFTSTTQETITELDSYHSTYEEKISFMTTTTYYYGLGFKVNDNVEINLLNFADLTKMHNWILGVNIRF